MEDVDVVITKYKIIPPGDKGNEYGDSPVIAFWYDTTNKSDKEITPITGWLAFFTAYQDNDKNKINELEVASHPDMTLVKDQSSIIKKGGTLSGAWAYKLTDNTTPVLLKAVKGYTGIELGTQEFKID